MFANIGDLTGNLIFSEKNLPLCTYFILWHSTAFYPACFFYKQYTKGKQVGLGLLNKIYRAILDPNEILLTNLNK